MRKGRGICPALSLYHRTIATGEYHMSDQYSPRVLEDYRDFLEHFPGKQITKSDTDADLTCPVHVDNHPSLGVDLRRNGHGAEILLHCRSQNCDRKKVLQAVGLTDQDRFLERDRRD